MNMSFTSASRVLRRISGYCALAGLALTSTIGIAQETLEARVTELLPTAEENRFLEIDWHTDLLKARERANAEGKPMFMWMMNGHPFGAT